MSWRPGLLTGASLAAAAVFGVLAHAQVFGSGNAYTDDQARAAVVSIIPQPASTVPPGPTSAGSSGSAPTYPRSDATPPSLTRSLRVTSSAVDGSFSVTWSVPLISSVPTAFAVPVDPTATMITCKVKTATSTGVTGMCMQTATQLVSLIGLTISLAPTPALSVPVSVFSREPTQ